MYDDSGNAVWYVASMDSTDEGRTFAGTLMHFSGGQTLLGPYVQPSGSPVGHGSTQVRIAFNNEREGIITFPAPDASRSQTSIPISRFAVVDGGLSRPLSGVASLPQVGWWWNPAEAGRGMFFEVQSEADGSLVLFSAIYGYEASGEPSWTIGISSLVPNGGSWVAVSMPLHRCSDGQVLGARGERPARCAPLDIGTTTIQFASSGTGAVITLPNGQQVPVQRYSF
jgi:hypothetical protein